MRVLEQYPHIFGLTFLNCLLDIDVLKAVISLMMKRPTLQFIQFNSCQTTDEVWIQFFGAVQISCPLRTIIIENCPISNNVIEAIANAVEKYVSTSKQKAKDEIDGLIAIEQEKLENPGKKREKVPKGKKKEIMVVEERYKNIYLLEKIFLR